MNVTRPAPPTPFPNRHHLESSFQHNTGVHYMLRGPQTQLAFFQGLLMGLILLPQPSSCSPAPHQHHGGRAVGGSFQHARCLHAQPYPPFCDPMDATPLDRVLCPRDFPARIVEWVAISSSRGIFPTQGSNPSLLHCRRILYC